MKLVWPLLLTIATELPDQLDHRSSGHQERISLLPLASVHAPLEGYLDPKAQ